jgi:16S rRNA (uracil1498-N3)-methyltransferase
MHRFYVPEITPDTEFVTIGKDETKHLRSVLRMKPGDVISVFDGLGNEFECELTVIEKSGSLARVMKQVEPASPESPLAITLAVGLLKGDKYDLVVQKSVELGIHRFFPMVTHRSEMKLAEAERKLERWRKIAFEAAKQCGRAKLMTVEPPTSFSELVTDGHSGTKILFAEQGGGKFDRLEPANEMFVMIGPKGGWEPEEIETAEANGFTAVTFGGRIMRVETAAIAICAILQHRFGDMN